MPQKNWLELQIESNISIHDTPDTVDINEQNEYEETPLNWACKNNFSIEIIQWLIEKKADVAIADKEGNTPLHYACQNKDTSVEILKLLHYASQNKDTSIEILKLLDCEENINRGSLSKNTPLCLAVRNGLSLDTIKFLVESGADRDSEEQASGMMPLHIACIDRYASVEILKLLVSDKNINWKIACEWTPLHLLAANFEVNLAGIKYLRENGADINSVNEDGKTPLHLACENRYMSVEILKFLISEKNINLKNYEGKTPVDLACEKNQPEIVKMLILYGAKKPEPGLNKWTEEIENLLKLSPNDVLAEGFPRNYKSAPDSFKKNMFMFFCCMKQSPVKITPKYLMFDIVQKSYEPPSLNK